tara:strand:- start:17110 stop:18342 length:1233 start_codon:yes stop_codon:yes gene_type:complete
LASSYKDVENLKKAALDKDSCGTVCMIPWEGMAVTMRNEIRPCCRFPGKAAVAPELYEEAFKGLRQNMLAGVRDERCRKCWEEEDAGIPSMRTRANIFHGYEFKKDILTEKPRKLTHIELSLDNICNFQCRMCGSQFSSKALKRDVWLQDNHPDVHIEPAKVQKSRYETLKDMNIDWSELRSVKLLGGEPFMSPNFMDFLYFLDMRTDVSKVDLEIVTNCSYKMPEEMAEMINEFKFLRLSGSFDGTKKINEYQRVGSNWEEGLSNWLEYRDLLTKKRMVIHQTFSVLNVNTIDESLALYEPHCDSQSWSYDEYQLSFLCAPDWFEEWVLSTNKNEKLRNIFKKRVHDDEKWKRVMRTIYALDEFHETNIEEANPELARLLRINNKRRIYNHKCNGDPDCFYCNMYQEVI